MTKRRRRPKPPLPIPAPPPSATWWQDSLLERHPLGKAVAGHLVIEQQQRDTQGEHHPMRLGIAIQFWRGDQAEALRLARFLADLETKRRDDVVLLFARRFDVPMSSELEAAMTYCGRKFTVSDVRSERIAEGHPAGCFGLWAGTAEQCYARYVKGWPIDNVLFVESDGAPTRFDWIDHLKRLHQQNLDASKRVTGPRMEACSYYPTHINGTMVMHMSCWGDHLSLRECPPRVAWDCFHGQVLVSEAGPAQGILNLYGTKQMSLPEFKVIGRDYAWIASAKDRSVFRCAQSLLDKNWRKLIATVMPPAPSTPTSTRSPSSTKRSNTGRSKSGRRRGAATAGPRSSSAGSKRGQPRKRQTPRSRSSRRARTSTVRSTPPPRTCAGSRCAPLAAG
jgi:hypothetical protein